MGCGDALIGRGALGLRGVRQVWTGFAFCAGRDRNTNCVLLVIWRAMQVASLYCPWLESEFQFILFGFPIGFTN
jgi:hypothetical protein